MTTHASVLAYLFLHVGLILVVTAYFTVGAVLAPTFVERARTRLVKRPWLAVLIGLALTIPWAGSSLLMIGSVNAVVKFAGAAMLSLWVLAGLFGGAAIARQIGEPNTSSAAAWRPALRGGLLLSLTWILPVVGWLIALPLTLATGVGCLALGLAPDRSSTPVVPVTVVPIPAGV